MIIWGDSGCEVDDDDYDYDYDTLSLSLCQVTIIKPEKKEREKTHTSKRYLTSTYFSDHWETSECFPTYTYIYTP